MSIKVMSWYWDNSECDGHLLLALLALADWANDDGECYPSIARLSQRLRRKERATQYVIEGLERASEILVHPGQGKGKVPGQRTPLYYLLRYREAQKIDIPPIIVQSATAAREHDRKIGKRSGLRKSLQISLTGAMDCTPTGAMDCTPTGAMDCTPTGAMDCTPTGAMDCTQIHHIDPSYRSVSMDPSTRVDPPPPMLGTPNGGGGGLPTHTNGYYTNGINGNGHHATVTDSSAVLLRSPRALAARTLATEWAADFAAGWAALEADMAGWTEEQVHCLLTWLYVWAVEVDTQDRTLDPAVRYDAGQRLAASYAHVFAGATNRIGLIKSKVKSLIAVPLTTDDAAALESAIVERM